MLRTVDFIIVVAACLGVGYGAGFYFGARHQEIKNPSLCAQGTDLYNDCLIELKGCNQAAVSIEEELQDTRWNLGNCEYKIVEMIGQVEKLRHMIFKDNSLE